MRIGFFDTKEFESKDGKPSPFDDTVVKRELIVMLNAIRSRYGRPIVINSGYRSPAHNAAVGGVIHCLRSSGVYLRHSRNFEPWNITIF